MKTMKAFALLISIICFMTTFAIAQKSVRKRTKLKPVQTPSNQTNSGSNQKKLSQLNTHVKILDKPRPQLFPDGQDCSQRKVVLRVTFLASGKIGTISVISGITKGKTQSSIEAAKKIKFEPAMKNGKPGSVTKIIEYNFTIY